jgi:hypothetical protein
MRSSRKAFLRFVLRLRQFLDSPITFEQARSVLTLAQEQRTENFLQMLRRCVYANPASPYLPLLRKADCVFEDAAAAARRDGLEKLLAQLKTSGVWVGFDEFKAAQSDFNNYSLSSGCEVSTGGTSGRAARTHLDLDHLAFRACYDRLFFQMLDLDDVPLALWYPKLPAVTGVANSLRYAKLGKSPDRWFSLLPTHQLKSGRELSMATSLIVWISRFSLNPLPKPERLEMENVNGALDWILQNRRGTGRCVFQSYVSQAVRIAQAAQTRGEDLAGVLFIVGSEPLTDSKKREIQSAGARVYARYHATEIGTIGIECGCTYGSGDYHLATPSVAVISDDNTLHFTSLLSTAPKILINVQLGDAGIIEERQCGCLIGELGLSTHLSQISGIQKATGEGMTVSHRELARVIEEVLVPKYGGTSLDYQWVEREDARSLTRLCLRISPDRGAINETELIESVLVRLRRGDAGLPLAAELWRRADTIQVINERPQPTTMGKIMAVVRDGPRK